MPRSSKTWQFNLYAWLIFLSVPIIIISRIPTLISKNDDFKRGIIDLGRFITVLPILSMGHLFLIYLGRYQLIICEYISFKMGQFQWMFFNHLKKSNFSKIDEFEKNGSKMVDFFHAWLKNTYLKRQIKLKLFYDKSIYLKIIWIEIALFFDFILDKSSWEGNLATSHRHKHVVNDDIRWTDLVEEILMIGFLCLLIGPFLVNAWDFLMKMIQFLS